MSAYGLLGHGDHLSPQRLIPERRAADIVSVEHHGEDEPTASSMSCSAPAPNPKRPRCHHTTERD